MTYPSENTSASLPNQFWRYHCQAGRQAPAYCWVSWKHLINKNQFLQGNPPNKRRPTSRRDKWKCCVDFFKMFLFNLQTCFRLRRWQYTSVPACSHCTLWYRARMLRAHIAWNTDRRFDMGRECCVLKSLEAADKLIPVTLLLKNIFLSSNNQFWLTKSCYLRGVANSALV